MMQTLAIISESLRLRYYTLPNIFSYSNTGKWVGNGVQVSITVNDAFVQGLGESVTCVSTTL